MLRLLPLFIFAVLLVLVAYVLPSYGEEAFFQWTNPSTGAAEFADSVDRVPAGFRQGVVRRTWADLRTATEARRTPMAVSDVDYSARFLRAPVLLETEQEPVSLEDCDAPTQIVSERVQIGSYNRRMYSVLDECGNVLTYTPAQPRIYLGR